MATPKATAVLELAQGEKNKKGITLKTNRFKVEGDVSGVLYVRDTKEKKFEVVLKPIT